VAWWRRQIPQPITVECETICGELRKLVAVTVPAGTPWDELETILVGVGIIEPENHPAPR
jgi:hypothetical protein